MEFFLFIFLLYLTFNLLFLSQATWTSAGLNGNASVWKCPHEQQSALLQLKSGFSMYAMKLDSWIPSTDCCSWEGIVCNETTGQVIGLDLSESAISGQVDSILFHLGSLRILNLAYNSLDSIPSRLDQLTDLTHLNLSYCGDLGQIPLEISPPTRLISLDLSGLDMKLEAPTFRDLLQNLSSLEDLHLNGVTISAHGDEWGKVISSALPNLRILSLSGCGLAGPIDPSLAHLHFLSELDLSENNLSTEVPNFLGNFSSLTSLMLTDCGFFGNFPTNVFLLSNLQTLDISDNPLLKLELPEFPHDNAFQLLQIGNTSLSGKLPDSFSNLKFLKALWLANCNLTGSLPLKLGNLTQLEHLDLRSNKFQGPIPSSFGDGFPQLNTLILSNNSLEGSIPSSLFSHPSLRILELGMNKLSSWFDDFHNVSSSFLEDIVVSDNLLQGPIPRPIFEFPKLRNILLSSNNLSGTIELEMFQSLTNLNSLDLSYNNLSIISRNTTSSVNSSCQIAYLTLRSCNISELPNMLRTQKKIKALDLSNNKIHGEIPNWIWEVGNETLYYLNLSHNLLKSFEHPLSTFPSRALRTLDLRSNMFQGSFPKSLPSVSYLDFSNNNFTSIISSNINLTSTRFFFLSNNSIRGEMPSSICNAKELQVLDLSHNQFSASIPECIGKVSNTLTILNLQRNALQGTLPQTFTKRCSLLTLNLNGNQLEGPLPHSLANCEMLDVLDIGNNFINDTFPIWLENLSKLRVLVLRSNKFHGPVSRPQSNRSFLPMLQIIDLSSNDFVGEPSAQFFWSLKAMMGDYESQLGYHDEILRYKFVGAKGYYHVSVTVTIKGLEMQYERILALFICVDFSNNRFEGEIPKSIGDLKFIYGLNFSRNSFTGQIPVSLESLTHLESFDLSHNKLSGEIPWQLTKLTFLAVLNLSQNLLTGRIPQGNQFHTFTNDSFLGNFGLCGPPLTKECRDDSNTPISIFKNVGSQAEGEFDWQFLLAGFGVGYVVGLGMVIWHLMFWKKVSREYKKFFDKILELISLHG